VLVLALVLIFLNPVGYVGGGWDDYRYLTAIRCTAEHGFCIPTNHWERRFPLVLPLGYTTLLLGESRETLWIGPLVYSLAAVVLLVTIVKRQFGHLEALIAGTAFVLTPVINQRMLEIGIDIPELTFFLAALLCLQLANRNKRRTWMAASGLLLGLAVLCRPTMLAMVPPFATTIWFVPELRRHSVAWLVGFALPIGIEAGVYLAAAGDPLLGWRLSLAHTTIPSTQLAPSVDLSRSPLFNVSFIDGWTPAVGINAHWTVKGIINLMLHVHVMFTFLFALAFAACNLRYLVRDKQGKILGFAFLASCWYFGALTYVFAIDPKPRMFLPLVAVASAMIGVLSVRSWRWPTGAVVVACIALLGFLGFTSAYLRINLREALQVGAQWLANNPSLTVEPNTIERLALEPIDLNGRSYKPGSQVLVIEMINCRNAALEEERPSWRLLREHRIFKSEAALIRFLRDRRLFSFPQLPTVVCVFAT
jgi:4-amino-4-deoxy-L-arabinose transferase-like glycosyltransferase